MITTLEKSQKEQDVEVLIAEKKYWQKEIKNCKKKIEALREYMNQCYLNIMGATEKLDEKKNKT